MDLLIIKCGRDYLHVREDACTTVGLDKASVFPTNQLGWLKDRLSRIRSLGFPKAAIYRLTLTESPLEE